MLGAGKDNRSGQALLTQQVFEHGAFIRRRHHDRVLFDLGHGELFGRHINADRFMQKLLRQLFNFFGDRGREQ